MTRDLSSAEAWDAAWEESRIDPGEPLRIEHRGFDQDFHRLMSRHGLDRGEGRSCLELGCHPGRYLRHLHGLGYEVSGLEYVESRVGETKNGLQAVGVESEIFHGDFRFWEPDRTWDLVLSFGLVEHFDDAVETFAHHARFVRPGGHLLVTYPLHDGVYGGIMNWAAPDRLAQHNRMSMEDGKSACEAVDGLSLVESTFMGRFGFGTTRLIRRVDNLFPTSKLVMGVPLRVIERIGRGTLPNHDGWSPFAGLLCRRDSTEA